MAATDLLIFPCNGNALEALDCLGSAFRCVGFVDDTPAKQGTTVAGIPVLSRSALTDKPQAQVLAVPGSPASFRMRRELIEGLRVPEQRFARVVHPMARVSPHASIGHNVLIMAGVVITYNARIGNHVCLLPNTVVHHDSSVGDFALVGSNVTVAGNTVVGANCYIGSGSSIRNGLTIGAGALIGIGSNLIRDVGPDAVVAGNPAKPLVRDKH